MQARFVSPMAARPVDTLPEGPEWLYEVKFDGYRALLLKNGDRVEIRSRNDKNLTTTYPGIAASARRLDARQATVDGEIVAVNASGRPSFQALQHRSGHAGYTIVFYAFDLLHLNGRDLTSEPLVSRRGLLPAVLDRSGILMSVDLPGDLQHVVAAVQSLGLEGVIAKRKSSRYTPGDRSASWLKLKLDKQQEFVVGGCRLSGGAVDALLVGYYERRELRFAAKVRAGFTPRLRREVADALKPFHADRCPFVDLPHARTSRWGGGVTADQMAEMQWLRPVIVAQVRFVEWTAEGHLRHAAFLGLRTDKRAAGIRRESF